MIYVELLEQTDFLSNPVNYFLFALARFGANGEWYPAPEVVCGGAGEENFATSRVTWDEDLSDGLDSDYVAVALDADLGDGTASWDVEGADSVDFDQAADAVVGSVRIVAATQVPGTATWSNLTITFYEDDVAQETVTVGGPGVDTTESSTGIGEQVLVVTPDSATYDRVSVCGLFRMSAAPEVYPGESDIFGQILVTPQAA